MIGLLADVHANIDALETVLATLAARGVEQIYCAGDLVGYNAAPNACCERLRHLNCVQGNHDWAALLDPKDPDLSWFNASARSAIHWTSRQLTPANRAFLAALPHRLRFQVAGRWVTIVHGTPRDPLHEYEYGDEDPEARLVQLLDEAEADILVMGHTHLPYVRTVGARLVINPGSVGQPRDQDPRTSCAILDPVGMRAEILRLDYDHPTAAQRVRDAGLPPALASRLSKGL